MRAESPVKVPLIDRSLGPIALWENKKQLVDPETASANEIQREGQPKGVGGQRSRLLTICDV